MKSGKVHQEEEEEDDEEFGTKKDATTSTTNTRDGRGSGKANVMRSKHSVMEQRRRSKINERFQILRDLIPNSDQKRDTASFLLEVIQYVQFLHEKVQKYEGSYQPSASNPTKLMPWRNSHWRIQSFTGQPQGMNNGSPLVSTFNDRFDESSVAVPTSMQTGQQNPMESDPIRNATSRSADLHNELPNKAMGMTMPVLASMPLANDNTFSKTIAGQVSDVQLTECPSTADALNHQDELTVEGGTISISSAYSQGLLNSLAQALQSTGVELSQASISVQINLGKRANSGPTEAIPVARFTHQDHGIPMPSGSQPVGTIDDCEDLDQAHKRLKF